MGVTVSIVGATGLVGLELLKQLYVDVEVDTIHVLLRSAVSDTSIKNNPKLIQHIVNFDHLADVQWPRSDVFFCCLGTTIKAAGSQDIFYRIDCDYVVKASRQAYESGATQLVVVSAMGANSYSRVFYNRVKGDMEAKIALIGFNNITIIRPSFLTGERKQSRAGEQIAVKILKLVDRLLPKKYRSVPAYAVAKCMITAAKEKHSGVRVVESDKIRAFA